MFTSMARRKTCPECESANQFLRVNIDAVGLYGPDLLPGTSGFFRTPKMHAVVCKDCGFIRYFADEKALERVTAENDWEKL